MVMNEIPQPTDGIEDLHKMPWVQPKVRTRRAEGITETILSSCDKTVKIAPNNHPLVQGPGVEVRIEP